MPEDQHRSRFSATSHFRNPAEMGVSHCVGLLTRALRRFAADPAFPETSSDRLSPIGSAITHTAAVPSGIHTRLSCSAPPVLPRMSHAVGYQIVRNIVAWDRPLVNPNRPSGTVICSRKCRCRRSRRCSPDSTGTSGCRGRSPWRSPGNSPPAGGRRCRLAPSGPGR